MNLTCLSVDFGSSSFDELVKGVLYRNKDCFIFNSSEKISQLLQKIYTGAR